MEMIKALNIEDSIRKQKLVYENDDNQYFNIIFEYIICVLTLLVILIIALGDNIFTNPTLRYAILATLIPSYIVAIVLLYRKVKNKKLLEIDTTLKENEALDKMTEYIHQINFDIKYKSCNCIVAQQHEYTKKDFSIDSVVLLIDNSKLYFTVIQKENILGLISQSKAHKIEDELRQILQ